MCFFILSPTTSVRLARSESLKAQGEGRRRGGGAGAESVPRSRSDVDMEDCEEREGPGLRPLHHSASSSASSSSARYETHRHIYSERFVNGSHNRNAGNSKLDKISKTCPDEKYPDVVTVTEYFLHCLDSYMLSLVQKEYSLFYIHKYKKV